MIYVYMSSPVLTSHIPGRGLACKAVCASRSRSCPEVGGGDEKRCGGSSKRAVAAVIAAEVV